MSYVRTCPMSISFEDASPVGERQPYLGTYLLEKSPNWSHECRAMGSLYTSFDCIDAIHGRGANECTLINYPNTMHLITARSFGYLSCSPCHHTHVAHWIVLISICKQLNNHFSGPFVGRMWNAKWRHATEVTKFC